MASPAQVIPSKAQVDGEEKADVDLEGAIQVIPSERAVSPSPDELDSPTRLSSTGGKKRVGDDEHSYSHNLNVRGVVPAKVEVTLNVAGQHILSWNTKLTPADGEIQEEDILPIGSCNLYLFPAVTTANGLSLVPEGDALVALQALLLAITNDPTCKLLEYPDVVGALPMHAITVANTPESLSMAEMMYTADPKLILQTHALHRAGFPLFTGESSLHICAVNQQESLLCTLIELCMEHLTKEEAGALFKSQATGVFFDDMPMRMYGGTPLSYACCFDLRKAILSFLQTGLARSVRRPNSYPRIWLAPASPLAHTPRFSILGRAGVSERSQ